MINVTPVILCDGFGARLWQFSRAGFSRQFLSLTGKESLFQQPAQRLLGLAVDDIEIIEVKSDSYLGKDVIVRIEDTCGRARS